MTFEQNLANMQKEYDQLSDAGKARTVRVGEQEMTGQELIDELTRAYSKLEEHKKSHIRVSEDGIMASMGDPDKALQHSMVGALACNV